MLKRALTLFLMASAALHAQEALFSDLNAYNPIPNANGSVVAFIQTGWGRPGGSGGFGRSNLKSVLEFASTDGRSIAHPPVDAFLDRWVGDDTVVCYRDWHFGTASKTGWKLFEAMPGDVTGPPRPERATYLSKMKSFVWLDSVDGKTLIQTLKGPLAEFGKY
jgi:hypothetical protein